MEKLQPFTEESYKYYRNIIDTFHKEGMIKAFGIKNSISEQAFWAFKRWCKEQSILKIPEYLKKKNKTIHYYNLTKEESDLSLYQMGKHGYNTEKIILSIMSKYNAGIHDLAPKKTIIKPPKVEDIYKKNKNFYLDIRKKGGKRRQIKLQQDTIDELFLYIESTKERRGNSPYLFITKEYYKGAPVEPLGYSAFWVRFTTNIKPLLYDTGCIPLDKDITPFSFKNADRRIFGSINTGHLERVI